MNSKKKVKAVVLAAGKSTRMKSSLSKVVHKILGKEIINFVLDNLVGAGIAENDIILVCGDNLDEVRGVVNRDVGYAIQEQQLGTADALLSARDQVEDFDGDLLVVVGDNPYVTSAEIETLLSQHRGAGAPCTLSSAVFPFPPPPYGRIIRDESGRVTAIVEEIDATPEQREIREVNAAIYLFDNPTVFPLLLKIDNKNAKGEYYLTDIIGLLNADNHRIEAVRADDYFVSIGINNRWELQEAQEKFNRARLKDLALHHGVTVLQPETVTVEYGVEIGADTVIYPSTYIAAGTTVGRHCRVGPFVYLEGVDIKDHETLCHEKRKK